MTTESSPTTPNSIWVPQATKAGGDCALHAIFGKPNSQGEYTCSDVSARRQTLREKVADSKPGSPLHRLALEGIEELMNSGRTIGAKSCELFEKYQQFLREQKKLISDSQKEQTSAPWKQFAVTLNQYSEINDYITKYHQHPKGTSANSYEKFYDALTRKKDELYNLISKKPLLDGAFKLYNASVDKPYEWEKHVSSAMLKEYAEFIGKSGQWLLASEVALIAEVFEITVEYYRHPNSPKPEIFNPKQSQTVTIRFDGKNHFERLIPPVEQKLPAPIASSSGSSSSSTSSLTDQAVNSSSSTVSSSSSVSTTSTSTTSSSSSTRPMDLRTGLQAAYRDELNSSLPMPLVNLRIPIQAISLTINTKKLQTIKDRELTFPIDKAKEEKKARNSNNGKG